MGRKCCLPYYHENVAFQVRLDLIYAMDKLPARDKVLGWETMIVPHFEEHFNSEDNEEIGDFLGSVEQNYVGKLNHRSGHRNKATFPPEILSNFKCILNNNQPPSMLSMLATVHGINLLAPTIMCLGLSTTSNWRTQWQGLSSSWL